MNIVVLYGPPASGKLTVAKKLAALTGFTLLHNHLIADLASSLFPYGTREYSNLA
jgi:adenylate kinase family enzyme